jgi:hypothetical protein
LIEPDAARRDVLPVQWALQIELVDAAVVQAIAQGRRSDTLLVGFAQRDRITVDIGGVLWTASPPCVALPIEKPVLSS